MPRKPQEAAPAEDGPESPTRVPVRVTKRQHDQLRELCLIRLRRPIEAVAGEWVAERLAQELKRHKP
jgi:hypothetical protein